MSSNRITLGLLSALIVLTLALGAPAQLTQTLPMGFETTDGNAVSPFPFNFANPQTWQFHYDSGQFALSAPIIITDIAFRAASATATVQAFNFPNFQVTMGEASTNYILGAHSSTFASNFLNSTVVKTTSWTGGPVPASGTTTATFIPVGLDTPFLYDPSSGNDLIIQLNQCSGSPLWGSSLDCVSGAIGAVGGNRYGSVTSCAATTSILGGPDFVPVIEITYAPVAMDDLALTSIDAPADTSTDCGLLSTTETVTAVVSNFGMNSIPAGTSITLSLNADNGASMATETFMTSAVLNTGDSESFTFTATVDFSSVGNHSITVSLTPLAGDADPSNDSKSKTVRSGSLSLVTSYPFIENFDGPTSAIGQTTPPANWRQDTNDASGNFSDWVFSNSTTPGGGGPSADHTTGTGFYPYVNDAGNHMAVNLISPCLDLTSLTTPALTFWVYSNNLATPTTANENFLHVDIITYPGPVVIPDAIPAIGHITADWRPQFVDLTPYVGQTIQIQFRGSSDGGGTSHDLAIDDVMVDDFTASPGQAPQPGIAVLDINNAQDVIGFTVPNGVNGPFFANASVQGSIDFHFEGNPNQAIVLLAGNLNVANVTFPGVGILDIGGPPNTAGIPTGIALLADGTQLGLPDFFFRTDAAGIADISFGTPNLPPGILTTFQAVILAPAPQLAGITNAVELTITP